MSRVETGSLALVSDGSTLAATLGASGKPTTRPQRRPRCRPTSFYTSGSLGAEDQKEKWRKMRAISLDPNKVGRSRHLLTFDSSTDFLHQTSTSLPLSPHRNQQSEPCLPAPATPGTRIIRPKNPIFHSNRGMPLGSPGVSTLQTIDCTCRPLQTRARTPKAQARK